MTSTKLSRNRGASYRQCPASVLQPVWECRLGALPKLDNTVRLHSSLGYRPSASKVVLVASHGHQKSN